jgi:hypothetical protein
LTSAVCRAKSVDPPGDLADPLDHAFAIVFVSWRARDGALVTSATEFEGGTGDS